MLARALGLVLRRRRRVRGPAEEFEGAVREACMRLGLVLDTFDGEVIGVRGRVTGLVALADVRAACALRPVEEWSLVVREALEGLAVSLETPLDLADLDAVRPLLRTRVYTEGAVLLDDVVRRPLAQGLVEVLVVDVRGAVRTVPGTVAAGWRDADRRADPHADRRADPHADDGPHPGPHPDLVDDLLDLGRRQVLDGGLLSRRAVDLGGVEVVACESPSAFAATHVAWLGTYVDPPPAGLLVALPTRHLVLCAPLLRRGLALDTAQALLVNAEVLEREGPGGLSPDLYWWRPGGLVLLPGTPFSLSPPREFLEVLDALPG